MKRVGSRESKREMRWAHRGVKRLAQVQWKSQEQHSGLILAQCFSAYFVSSLSRVALAFEGFPSLGALAVPLPELCCLQFVLGVAQSNLPQDLSRALSGYYRRVLRLH